MGVFLVGVSLFGAALIAAAAVPMWRGKVPRNPFYGFRTPATLASDAVWYPANRVAGRNLLIGAAITAAASPLLLLPLGEAGITALALVVNVGPLLGAALVSLGAVSGIRGT